MTLSQPYQIWIFTPAGVKVAYLERAFNSKRQEIMNEASRLSFSLPADDPKTAYLTSAYRVKVYNTKAAAWEGLYDIVNRVDVGAAGQNVVNVVCQGVIATLIWDDNLTYDSVSAKTPTEIATALLALQLRAPAITVGTIQPTTSFAISFGNASLSIAFQECVKYIGGYLDVDGNNALNWWNNPSGDPVREIRYRKNLQGITRTIDYSKIINKLYPYGGPDGDQIDLTTDEIIEIIPDDAHVKATTDARMTLPRACYMAVDMTTSLTGDADYNSWASTANTNQRFHVDLGSPQIVVSIKYCNFHGFGAGVEYGAKTVIVQGSNNVASFNDVVYGDDAGWVNIPVDFSEFIEHTAKDEIDYHLLILTNAVAYQYYALKFADNYGGAGTMGLRRLEYRKGSGCGTDYIEDVPSQGTYGMCVRRLRNQRITHSTTLLTWAQQVLSTYKDPIYTYTVDVANLAELPGYDYNLESLEIGQIVRVYNDDIGIDVDVKIAGRIMDLSAPQTVQLELANVTLNISATLRDLQDYISIVSNAPA